MNADAHAAAPVTGEVPPFAAVQNITLTEIEQAMRYWRHVAMCHDSDLPIPLHALEERYRRLLAARRGAIAIAQLSPDERHALRLWRQT